MRLLQALAAVILLAAPVWGQEPDQVWVNPRSGVYHCKGSPAHGTTRSGEYLDEAEARRRGFRANGGRSCGAVPQPQGLPGKEVVDTNYLLPDASPPMPRDSLVSCIVREATDGDTIRCETQGRVRLIGMDAPERAQLHAADATAALAALIPTGTTVLLERDVRERDVYDRLLAYVWSGGLMVNWKLVREGWALSVRYPPTLRYQRALDEAGRRAERDRRGIWRTNGFACTPADARRRLCR